MKILDADIDKVNGKTSLNVAAYAPTLGWTGVGLASVQYITPPADGIQDVILYGTPPSGVYQLPAIETFQLALELPDNDWIQGVRIKDSRNAHLLTLRTLVRGGQDIGMDEMTVGSVGLKGDKALVDISYSGGWDIRHDFQLSWDGSISKANPAEIDLVLSHNANEDAAKALLSEVLQFDLSTELEASEISEYVLWLVYNGERMLIHSPQGVS